MKRIALLSLAIAAFACKPAETSAEASSTTEPAAKTEESAKPEEAAKSDTVLLKTSMGEITIELDREKAPITVENFLSYVKKGHYDGTVFHRVMDGFMIQGGGFVKESSGLVEKTTGTGGEITARVDAALFEDTAAFLRPDDVIEVHGSGAITIVDPEDVEFSSMDSSHQDDPVCVIGVRLHVLIEGGTFDLATRTASPAPGCRGGTG